MEACPHMQARIQLLNYVSSFTFIGVLILFGFGVYDGTVIKAIGMYTDASL